MRPRSVAVIMGSVFALAFVFLLGTGSAQAAFNACACSCIDSEAVNSLLRNTPAQGETCFDVCANECQAPSVLKNAYQRTYTGVERCVCECSDLTVRAEWIALSPGKNDCRDDCIEACVGEANLDPTQNQQYNVKSVDCLRDDHCAVGPFSAYVTGCDTSDSECGDPRCEFAQLYFGDIGYGDWPDDPNAWPENRKPRCAIPPTRANADKECREYGGAARGGVCMMIPSGTSPAGYVITRPYVDSSGQYQTVNYTQDTLTSLNAALDADPPGPGLCYLYGLAEGVEYEFAEEIPIGIEIGEGVEIGPIASVEGSKRYICATRKSSTCGSETPPTDMEVPYASFYRCVFPDRVGITDTFRWCMPEALSREYCANDPGTLCCAEQVGVGCQEDIDCIPPKECMDINLTTGFGECDFNPVCDSREGTDDQGDAYSDRRCRPASESEKNNYNICSPPLHVMQEFGTRCLNPSYACCKPLSQLAIGDACAADMIDNYPHPAGSGGKWENYVCVTPDQIPSDQWVTTVRGTELIDWQSGDAYCLPNSAPAGGVTGPSLDPDRTTATGAPLGEPLERCTGNKICCDLTRVAASDLVQYIQGVRPDLKTGAACPGRQAEQGMSCHPTSFITDAGAQNRGYSDRMALLRVIADTPFCQVTPFSSGSVESNIECAPGYICCRDDLVLTAFCETDAQCSPNQLCDPLTKTCVTDEAYQEVQLLGGINCFNKAKEDGDQTYDLLLSAEVSEEDFTCQIVPEDSDAARTQCLQRGCDIDLGEGILAEGEAYRCCLPGVGRAPGAVAEVVSERAEDIGAGKYTIGLPPCIASGNCGLDDIVATGANFANLLIGLSGSVFLVIFVYAGFLYLTAGTSDRVGRAKKMLIQSTIAMVLILGAFVFVRFIQQSFVGAAIGEGRPTCGDTEETKGYQCIYLRVDPNDAKALEEERSRKGCVKGLCLEDKAPNYLCCPEAREE